jgi:histidinol phosphatase-like enzyme
MSEIKKTVLFADLDGTIITTVSGETFPTFIGDMKFVDGFLPALKRFKEENGATHLLIVTNQAGIEKGYIYLNRIFVQKQRT